jgi:hypothetical protein
VTWCSQHTIKRRKFRSRERPFGLPPTLIALQLLPILYRRRLPILAMRADQSNAPPGQSFRSPLASPTLSAMSRSGRLHGRPRPLRGHTIVSTVTSGVSPGIELGEKGTPHAEADVMFLPLPEAATTRTGGGRLLREVFPAGTSTQTPQNALKAGMGRETPSNHFPHRPILKGDDLFSLHHAEIHIQ